MKKHNQKPKRTPRARLLMRFNLAVVIVTTLGLVLLYIAHHVTLWPLELLASQFPLLLLALVVTFLGTLLLLRTFRMPLPSKKVLGLLGLAAIFLPLHSTGLGQTATPNTGPGTQLTYATYNKLYTNIDTAAATGYLASQHVDIVALQEVTPDEARTISTALGLEYTALSDESKSADGTEIALLSRYPIISTESMLDAPVGIVLRSIVDIPALGNTAVYTVHIVPPFSQSTYTQGMQSFDTLEASLTTEKLPMLLAGDFNTTVFSPKLRQLQEHVQIATAYTLPPCSWFSSASSPRLCMRIDHILHSDDFNFVSTLVGPHTGSDHRPVVTELTVPQ